jgi:hypothetical protein
MAIGVYFNFEGTKVDQYDEVCRKLNNGELITKVSDFPVGGCLAHVAWQEETGALGVFDVWESPEAFQSFGEKLMPLLGEAGFPDAQPHVVPVHNFVAA